MELYRSLFFQHTTKWNSVIDHKTLINACFKLRQSKTLSSFSAGAEENPRSTGKSPSFRIVLRDSQRLAVGLYIPPKSILLIRRKQVSDNILNQVQDVNKGNGEASVILTANTGE
jgi:hypothetical protein